MPIDGTLLAGLQARRNIPVRYNRELVARTLEAMTRIETIRARRERRFYAERMKGNRERQLEADRKLVRENQHLLPVEERERAEELVDEEGDEEMQGLEDSEVQEAVEDEAMLREEELKKAIRDEERARKAEGKPRTKAKGRRAIVGHGAEKMDVDG